MFIYFIYRLIYILKSLKFKKRHLFYLFYYWSENRCRRKEEKTILFVIFICISFTRFMLNLTSLSHFNLDNRIVEKIFSETLS
jgi:hypothetical protein